MKRKIIWLNHLIEFTVVLLGVLLAFQLDRCSTNNYQKRVVENHINEIIKETNFNKRSLENTIKISENHLYDIDSILYLIKNKGAISSINKLGLDVLNFSLLYTRKNAYNSFVASGDIRFLKDFSSKQKIIDLYEYYKWVEAFDQSAQSVFKEDYYPYLKEHFDFQNGALQDHHIYFSKSFINGLMAMRITSTNKLEKYKECLIEVDDFLKDFHEK